MAGPGCSKPSLKADPKGVVTITEPDLPAPTTAFICVAEVTLNDFAGVPPNVTLVAPVKLTPLIVTVPPFDAVVGVNEFITGALCVKPGKLATPPLVLTVTDPLLPFATVASILVGEITLNGA
jgi:hypothetical protein